MFGIPLPYLPPTIGALIWLTICFQVSLGLRWIKLGRKHFTIHKWIGIIARGAGPDPRAVGDVRLPRVAVPDRLESGASRAPSEPHVAPGPARRVRGGVPFPPSLGEPQSMEQPLELSPDARGKVRDIYDLGDDRLLLVATDRISAFDVVLPDPIPYKGEVLTQALDVLVRDARRHRRRTTSSPTTSRGCPSGSRPYPGLAAPAAR